LKLCVTISAVEPSGSVNFSAKPRGLASPMLSGMFGMPVKSENRTSTGLAPPVKIFALVSALASPLGSKTPTAMIPLAWTARE